MSGARLGPQIAVFAACKTRLKIRRELKNGAFSSDTSRMSRIKRPIRRSLILTALFCAIGCEPSKLVEVPDQDGGPWQLPPAQLPDESPRDTNDAGEPDMPDAGDLCPELSCGTWVNAGALVKARTRHSTALLDDGRVLVIGGEGEGGALASVEAYDPATGTFSEIASLQHARYDHQSIVLTDGRVLVVGGVQGISRVAEAEIFEPANGVFRVVSSLSEPRIGHTLTLLQDGSVLVVGGLGDESFATALERFDPIAETFATAATSTEPRYLHTATILDDGAVFIAGGMRVTPGVGLEYVERTERYVPQSGLSAGPMWLSTRRNHSATLLSSGQVLLAGGHHVDALSSVWLFEPTTNAFVAGPALGAARFAHQATELDNGALLFSGGIGDEAIAGAEGLGPDAAEFWLLPPMQYARHTHRATLLMDGSVLVTGGTAPGQGIEPVVMAERFVLQSP